MCISTQYARCHKKKLYLHRDDDSDVISLLKNRGYHNAFRLQSLGDTSVHPFFFRPRLPKKPETGNRKITPVHKLAESVHRYLAFQPIF